MTNIFQRGWFNHQLVIKLPIWGTGRFKQSGQIVATSHDLTSKKVAEVQGKFQGNQGSSRSRFQFGQNNANLGGDFQIFFIFIPTWGKFALIFFKWVETTNQKSFL